MTFYNELRTATETQRDELLAIPVIARALRGEIGRDEYTAFLREAYHHVKHTVPLLMACGSRLPERLGWLREATVDYIAEERGHEQWILADLAACGVDPDSVRRARPAYPTELMVAYAYHQVDRGHPVAFFGMVHVLEGTSAAIATRAAQAIRAALGLPAAAFTYLDSHGRLDVEHVAGYATLMERLGDRADRQAVLHAACMFYRLYGDVFRALPDAVAAQRLHAA